MNKFKLFLLFCISVSCIPFAKGQGINFETISLDHALSKARNPAEPKLVLVDCYTTWCIPCLEMANNEFPKAIAGDYINPRFVSVKIDMEKGEGIDIAKKYNVKAYPTFLILNSEGQEINRVVGKSTAEEFIAKVEAALDPKNSLPGLKAAYEDHKGMTTGMAYALALYQNGEDPSPVLQDMYTKVQDFERFSRQFIELSLGTVKFGSPFFRTLMMDKEKLDQALGTETINKYIFDKVRKDMYTIAAGNSERFNVFYTPEEVEEVAYTLGLLKLPHDRPESHMARIALFVVNKDIDGMIDYYRRYMWTMPSIDPFKSIVDGILMQQIKHATAQQKESILAYFGDVAKKIEKEAKQYRNMSQRPL